MSGHIVILLLKVFVYAYLQRQLTEKIDELTSELTIKKRDITRLTDSNKLLSKKISESRTVQLLTDKVRIGIHMYIHKIMYT